MQSSSDTPYMKKIEYVFYNEAKIREQVTDAKNKAAHFEIKNASQLSDPTAAEALRNLQPVMAVVVDNQILRYPEHWLIVIDKTKKWCRERGETFYRILRGRYLSERVDVVCRELQISSDYFYRTLEKIRNYAALNAAWYHLIAF